MATVVTPEPPLAPTNIRTFPAGASSWLFSRRARARATASVRVLASSGSGRNSRAPACMERISKPASLREEVAITVAAASWLQIFSISASACSTFVSRSTMKTSQSSAISSSRYRDSG